MRQEYENMVQKCEEKNKMIEELQKIIEQNINSISKETNIEEVRKKQRLFSNVVRVFNIFVNFLEKIGGGKHFTELR